MKFSVGIAVLYLALCQASPGWKEGKKYVYDLTAKVGTGVSDDGVTQFAGKGIKAKLWVFLEDGDLAIEYHDIKTADFNRQLHNVFESVELDYQPLTDPAEVDDYNNVFKYRFNGIYGKDGRIIGIKYGSRSGPESLRYTNVQKAILSLFQLVFPSEKPHDHYYIVEEDGIGGNCNTTYLINHYSHELEHDEEVMNITKNYHYDECTHSPHWFFSSWAGGKWENSKEEHFKALRRVGRVDYQVKGNRNEYTIERIDANGYIGYTPFSTNGQTAMSITNQTLILESIEDHKPSTRDPSQVKEDGLHYKFGGEYFYTPESGKGDLYAEYDYYAGFYKNSKLEMESLIPKLSGNFHEHTNLAVATKKLVNFLKTQYKISDLRENYEFFANDFKDDLTPEERELRNYLVQLLPIVGTRPAIQYFVELVLEKKIGPEQAVPLLGVLPFHVKSPNMETFEQFEKLTNSDYINSEPSSFLYSAVWMAYGTLINKACIEDDFNPHPPHTKTFLSKEHCDDKIKTIVDKLHATSTHEEQNVLVRALMNTQTETAFNIIIDEVMPTGSKYDALTRTAASGVARLIGGCEHKEEKVFSVFFQILTNVHEDTRLRTHAFNVLLGLAPSEVFFSNLVIFVNQEPSTQLSSHIHSVLSSLANSTDPCDQQLSEHARHVLPYIVPKTKYDILRHSYVKKFSYFNEKHNFGRTTNIISFAGNDTAFPGDFYIDDSFEIGGYTFTHFDGGITQRHGHLLDSAFAAMLGQDKLILYPSFKDGKYGLAKHYDYSEFLTAMKSEISFMLFGKEAYMNQNMKFVKDLAYIKEIGDKMDIRYSLVNFGEMEYVIPNLAGLGTHLHLHVPGVSTVSGTVGFQSVELDLDIKVISETQLSAAMFVEIPASGSYGYQLKTDAGTKFTVKGTIEYDLEKGELKTKRVVHDEPFDFLHYTTQPYTYTRNKNFIPIKYSDKPIEAQYKVGHDYFGVGVKVQVKYDKVWNDYGYYKDFANNIFQESLKDCTKRFENIYAGYYGFLDYSMLNPRARPFHFTLRIERSTTNPTEEFHYTWKKSKEIDDKTDDDHAVKKSQLSVDIVAKGPVERKWSIEVKEDRHWPVNDHNHWNFHFKRSPIPNYDDKTYEVCFDSKIEVQGVKEIIENPLHPAKEPKVKHETTVNAGETCGDGSRQITYKGEGSRSEEQRSFDIEKYPLYQKCKEDYTKGYEYSFACWQLKKRQGQLDQWTLDIEYDKNINPKIKDFFYRVFYWHRRNFYSNLQVEHDVDTGIAENHVRVQYNNSFFQPIFDVHVTRPHERVHYRKVYMPNFEPMTIVEPFWRRSLRKDFRFTKPRCFLSGDYVYTLDGVQYKYALGECWHVAVANSLRENVVLLFRGVSEGKYTKALKLVVDDSYVTIEPHDGKLVVSVDGKALPEKSFLYHEEKNGDGQCLFKMFTKHQGYVVKSKVSGLKVYFDGRNAVISVSNLYHGVQNGMCGDFNNEKYHEFQAVDGTLYKNGADFAHSYEIKDECKA